MEWNALTESGSATAAAQKDRIPIRGHFAGSG